jgi:hypothetical protein
MREQRYCQPYESAARIALDPTNPRPVEMVTQLDLMGMLAGIIYTNLLTDECPVSCT